MLELKPLESKTGRRLPSAAAFYAAQPRQRRLMLAALVLLVVSLVGVLYHDRDFWFPDAEDAVNQLAATEPPAAPLRPEATVSKSANRSMGKTAKARIVTSAPATVPPITATATRTVLPPLEVEVVAGDVHRTFQPPSNEVNIDLQPDRADQQTADEPWGTAETAENIATNASERVEMSGETSDAVSRSVTPSYPLLARQMKVEGSVILMAMISRDGTIQELRVLSGPPILASSAREAVKQWHFKPHYEGSQPVETVARVTVNFTISTN